jgi:hypothetical protein
MLNFNAYFDKRDKQTKNINKDVNSNAMGSKEDGKWIESEKKTFLCKKS